MFDVFYKGTKPNLFAFEKPASSLEDAAQQSKTAYYWFIYGNNDYSEFNFDYTPVPWQSEYIHTWPNQWQQDGEVYLAKKTNNGQHHFHEQIVPRLPNREYWYIPQHIDPNSIDWKWCPDPCDPPYRYHFPSQHQSASGAYYQVPGATADKLVDAFTVRSIIDIRPWTLTEYIDFSSVDFSWHPNPLDPPCIYHFPSQHQSASGLTYIVSGATDIKLSDAFVVTTLPDKTNWYIPEYIDETGIDFSWHPNAIDPPLNYHFAVHWNWDNIGGPEYRMTGACDIRYTDALVAKTRAIMTNWRIPSNIKLESFDFSWVPHPKDPAYIYKFPTVWNNEGGPEYHVPGATQEKYCNDQYAETLIDMTNWTVPEEVSIEGVDFSWVPHPKDPAYIYHFGTDYQQSIGLTYTVPGATEDKFAGPIPKKDEHTNTLKILEIFFIDKGNEKSQVRFDMLSANYSITKVRYVNSMFETIQRCMNRAKGNKFWVISSEYNYENFDFAWHAEPWQSYMTHVFPSRHNKWSDTFLINRWEFERHVKWATSIEQFPNLNFVQDQLVDKTDATADIYYVDHGNPESDDNYNYFKVAVGEVIRTRFVGEYLDVMKRIVNNAETEYVWIVSSLCKYNYFDFTWEPEPWQREMIHCFATVGQKRGDTFYIHVESFKKQMVELELLDWFNVINYVEDIFVERYPMPIRVYDGDDLVSEIKHYDFKTPYVTFTNQPDLSLTLTNCLWSSKDRTVVRATRSGATCIVPRDIKQHLQTQIYDYPYLEKHSLINEYYNKKTFPGIDIVYISNGEPDEEKWYDTLCYVSNNNGGEVKWIRGVNGRTAAYQAAARASTTPWFFAVFAKIEVDVHFPWREWMPDYWQEPKHYIFNARNPVNGLEYGHQGVLAYNKRLVLENNTPGIDFTLSQPHESVPILSGTAHFNQDPWMTWRTAFREVIKLKHFDATAPTLENSHRLEVWCTQAKGNYAEYCLKGAQDAVAYYNEVDGDYELLKLSFEWQWLRERFNGNTL